MEENDTTKKKSIGTLCWCIAKDHCCDLRDFFKTWFCYYLAKVTGNKCEDRKILTLIVAVLCLCLMSVGVLNIAGYIKNYFWNTSDMNPEEPSVVPDSQQAANVITATTDINIEVPLANTPGTFSKCDLNTGEWLRWFGKINQDFEDKTHFTLPTNSNSALFKYVGKIDDFSTCEFTFIPRSENSINYVLSLDDVYQIVIGDNDFWTVAARSTDSIGGDLVPIKENSTQKTRPRLSNKIKNGTTVKVILNQKFIDASTYQIELIVSYKPDSLILNEVQTSTFSWTFQPSPAILDNPSLSIGLIRGIEDKSEIGVNFVDPKIGHDNKEVDAQDHN